jgi:hypothetical protein
MRKLHVRRPSPALAVSMVALFVAMGGTGYAAITLPKNSVKAKQIVAGAVGSSEVKNKSLKLTDFASSTRTGLKGPKGDTGAVGPAGAAGAAGAPGAPGPGAKWALVKGNGTIIAQSGGISITDSVPGGYYVDFGSSTVGHPILVSAAYAAGSGTTAEVSASPCGGTGADEQANCLSPGTNNANHVFVLTLNSGGTQTARPFYIAVLQ